VAAAGPTVATFVTAWVAYRVYSQGEKAQRLLTRPRLGFTHSVKPTPVPNAWLWGLSFRNNGQSTAEIIRVIVLVDGTPVDWQPLEQPAQYWTRILAAIGLTPGADFLGWQLVLPESLGGGSEMGLGTGTVTGTRQAANAVFTRIEVRITYKSVFGDTWTESSRTGEVAADN